MDETTKNAILALRRKVLRDRERELTLAMRYAERHEDLKSRYHTGRADGMNGMARELQALASGIEETAWAAN